MIHAATGSDAAASRFARTTAEGKLLWRSMFFGPAPSPMSSDTVQAKLGSVEYVDPAPGETRAPQAFLIEQEPGATVPPHFHYVDQFQVIVAGGGLLGRHAVGPLSVHFAAASTGYGPIQAGDDGLFYFTCRASADETGAQYLPAARERMRPVPRRNVVIDDLRAEPADAMAARGACRTETSREDPDGLGVFMLRLAPGQSLQAPDAGLGAGMTLLVAGGALLRDGRSFPAWSCFFVPPAEGALTLTADAAGADVLAMRYPRPAAT